MSEEPPRRKRSLGRIVVYCLLGLAAAFGFLALFIPNFVRACGPSKHSCIANLKQIDGAVQQWALENKLTATDTYSLTEPNVLAYLKGSVLPTCAFHGIYSAGTNVSDSPRCSIAGHTL